MGFRRPAGEHIAEVLDLGIEVLVEPEHQRGELDLEARVGKGQQVSQLGDLLPYSSWLMYFCLRPTRSPTSCCVRSRAELTRDSLEPRVHRLRHQR